jgi:hypothetical protein
VKLIPTHGLRWNFGVLEQRYLKLDGSTEVWLPVPDTKAPLEKLKQEIETTKPSN